MTSTLSSNINTDQKPSLVKSNLVNNSSSKAFKTPNIKIQGELTNGLAATSTAYDSFGQSHYQNRPTATLNTDMSQTIVKSPFKPQTTTANAGGSFMKQSSLKKGVGAVGLAKHLSANTASQTLSTSKM